MEDLEQELEAVLETTSRKLQGDAFQPKLDIDFKHTHYRTWTSLSCDRAEDDRPRLSDDGRSRSLSASKLNKKLGTDLFRASAAELPSPADNGQSSAGVELDLCTGPPLSPTIIICNVW